MRLTPSSSRRRPTACSPRTFFSTTNLPTYVRIKGAWRMPREPRMDASLVLDDDELWIREGAS